VSGWDQSYGDRLGTSPGRGGAELGRCGGFCGAHANGYRDTVSIDHLDAATDDRRPPASCVSELVAASPQVRHWQKACSEDLV